jgi:hypothetical protein
MKKKIESNKLMKCCYGISSDAGLDGRFGHTFMMDFDTFMMDFDGKCDMSEGLNDILAWLKKMQDEWGLSNIYVIRTKHGFNAMSCDIMPLKYICQIGNRVDSPCDMEFIKFNKERGYFTLRFGKDKDLVTILPSGSQKYVKSNAHRLFLEWYFNIEIEPSGRFNTTKKIKIIQYTSDKNGHHYQSFITERKGLVTSI